jgi:hypothetical protein
MKHLQKVMNLKFICQLALGSALAFCTVDRAQSQAFGLTGGYYMTNLWNVDDANADQRLDFVSTLKYGGGVEYLGWVNKNFGVGLQAQYLMKGQDYTSFDTINKLTTKFATTLNYAQISLLAYHRSYNRYKPEARFRFVSFFGPYFGFLPMYRDQAQVFDATGKQIAYGYYDNRGYNLGANDSNILKLKGQLYKNYDVGFVVAPGFEVMLSPKMALTFNVRADFGARSIENKTNLRKVLDVPPYEAPYYFWNDLYAKYSTNPTSPLPPEVTQYNERARTTTFTAGAFLGLRFYTQPAYFKSGKRF